jgi:hypothetical protein
MIAGNKKPAIKAGSMCSRMSAAQNGSTAWKVHGSVSESIGGRAHSLPDLGTIFLSVLRLAN